MYKGTTGRRLEGGGRTRKDDRENIIEIHSIHVQNVIIKPINLQNKIKFKTNFGK
jgi:hypothetical protein